jgi:hypothetical protein
MESLVRVIVTGSRSWREPLRIYEALDTMCSAGDLTVVHGDCQQGADSFARDWCQQAQYRSDVRVTEERHPADWKQHGRRAGFLRNEEMVRAGADTVLAFADYCPDPACPRWDTYPVDEHATHGTEHCMNTAARAGIEVIVFWSQT